MLTIHGSNSYHNWVDLCDNLKKNFFLLQHLIPFASQSKIRNLHDSQLVTRRGNFQIDPTAPTLSMELEVRTIGQKRTRVMIRLDYVLKTC